MARYISKAQRFKKSLRKTKLELVNTPQGPEQKEVEPPVIAFFTQGGATQREIEMALERFRFKGLAEGERPASRLSIFDTDEQQKALGWTDEEKAEFEAVLDAGQGEFYFKVEQEKVAKPWASYDQTPAADVLKVAEITGTSLEHVLAYERENKSRTTVIEALEKAAESEVVVQA